jgi:hypothetical protein
MKSLVVFWVLFETLSSACPANSIAYTISIGVGLVVWMTVRAMSFAGIYGRHAFSTKQIFSMCNWFKMPWICTMGDSTKVVQHQSFWDGAYKIFISKSMSKDNFCEIIGSKIFCEPTIPIAIFVGGPLPTSSSKIYGNFGEDSFNCRNACVWHESPSLGVNTWAHGARTIA